MNDGTHRTPRFERTLFEGGFVGHEFDQALIERNAKNRGRLEAPAPDTGPGWVQIIHGANEDVLPLGGRTVGDVRFEFEGLFNIDPSATAFLDGDPIEGDHLLRHGETLEFIRLLGRKGIGRVWTREEFCEVFKIGGADLDAMIAKGLPVHHMEDDSIRITETQVDDFLDQQAAPPSSPHNGLSSLIVEIRRIADALDPPPPDLVDSGYVAGKLGCTTTWIADMARNGEIPTPCIVPGTGRGRPWKFRRTRIDEWIARR
jgi:hypothetical protein